MCIKKDVLIKAFTPKEIGTPVSLEDDVRYYDWLTAEGELHLFPEADLPHGSDKIIFLGDYHWSIYLNELTCNGVTTTVTGHAKVRLRDNHPQYRYFTINLLQKHNNWVVSQAVWTNGPVNPRNTTYREATILLTAANAPQDLGVLISDQLNALSLQALQTI